MAVKKAEKKVPAKRKAVTRRKASTPSTWQSTLKKVLVTLVLLCGLALGGWKAWNTDFVQMRYVYMWDYQQDIITYENNIGFFSASKNSAPLIAQMQERIEKAKLELKELEQKIREAEEGDE